jgi:hypothetical protein
MKEKIKFAMQVINTLSILTIMTFIIFCSNPSCRGNAKDLQPFVPDTVFVIDTVYALSDSSNYVPEVWLRQELKIRGIYGDDLERMLFIAKRESSLNAKAYNSTLNSDGSHDSGLFQINSCHRMLWTRYNLLNPVENIEAAVYLYNNSKFSPWHSEEERSAIRKGTYNADRWRDYVPNKHKIYL